MSLEQTIGNLEIRYANVVTFVGSSNTMVDTTTGRIQTKGIQHNSNVITDVSGPHGRIAPTLKKYPEIAFESGKFDSNDSTNTYVQAGYTVTDSSHHSEYYGAWIFDDQTGFVTDKNLWISPINTYTTSGGAGTPTMTTSDSRCTTVSGVATPGEWVQIKLPNKVKLSSISVMGPTGNGGTGSQDLGRAPKDAVLAGSVDGTTWNSVLTWSGAQPYLLKTYKSFPANVDSTNYYNYFRLIVTKNDGTHVYASIQELQLYGYEEDPPAGDHSVDTTFKSRFNNPQLTGVQVLVDGATGVGTNQISGGPDPSGNDAPMTSPNKYWTLNGTLTSNLAVEANTFLEGDQPHAVSVWFNSSNLEANVSNTCVFSIASEEKLDSVNLDLQSNTWHNLTYAYQGEGGSRVAYLDGRKVSEDQAEDTFGEYPPFAMTGYSQGGYVVSASGEYNTTEYNAWKAFDGDTTTHDNSFITPNDSYVSATGATKGDYLFSNAITDNTSTVHRGEWIKMEFPHKLVINSVKMDKRPYSGLDLERMLPAEFAILGSNDDQTWYLIHNRTGIATNAPTGTHFVSTGNYKSKGFKYVVIVLKKASSNAASNEDHIAIGEITFYGHRENDLVRLPDPTNVLKYPHIAMTGPAQRGYTTRGAQLELNNDAYDSPSWKAFRGTLVDNSDCYFGLYVSGAAWYYNTDGTFNSTSYPNVKLSSQTPAGDYITLGLPHKLVLNSFDLTPRTIPPSNSNSATQAANESAQSFEIWGSNDNSTWYHINTYDNTSITPGTNYAVQPTRTFTVNWANSTATPNTPTAYKHIGLVVKSIFGNDFAGVRQLFTLGRYRLYGTEENSSIPIQIGGGNIDKVANFRVYDKFIGEDQVNEIWNAQKEEFGRAKPQMVLQQGKLGIGTDAPQGSLSVADEPHVPEEFPPRAMTGYKTYMEGHGEFCVINSTFQEGGQEGWKAFDGVYGVPGNGNVWISGNPTYNTDGTSNGTSSINGEAGEYLILEMPYNVKMKSVLVYPRGANSSTVSYSNPPKNGKIWGKNGIDSVWEELTEYSNLDFGATITDNVDGQYPQAIQINAVKAYKYIAFQVQVSNHTLSGTAVYTNLRQLRYFGTREQGQSVLHDGQLTLTKNLTVPRIGPAFVEYPTPRQDKIHLQYDTSLSIHHDTHIMDTSGRSIDLSRQGNGYYNSGTESLHFDGNDSYYNTTGIGDWSDNQYHTHSLWVKTTANSGNPVVLWNAVNNNHDYSGISINAGSHFSFWHFGNDHNYNYNVQKHVWYHVVAVYNGNSGTQKMYINGEEIPVTTIGTISSLSMGTNPKISLGGDYGRLNYYFTGEISKYRLHSVALTPEEVFTLYKQGRTTPVHHLQLVDSTMTIGSHNRHMDAQLDVAGHIRAGSSTMHTFTGQHRCFPDEPMKKGLIVSAKKNQFVKLNGFATGQDAITIDESLPIVSLSNVVQDKACFGVVSSIEKSTPRRSQIVNGIISDAKKEKGDNRAIVNSVGEGAIWVVDTNGPLESGDYITTSNVAGYGQKQDDDVLHNFTVAKITMDCDFTGSNVAVQTIKREQTGTRTITEDAWNQLVEYDRYSNVEDEITTYYQIQRGGNVLDENGQLQFEDKTGATEEPYERRFLTADGSQTDEANTVHTAAFVGCTYHCG
jgi:hypothetical protein